MCLMQIGENLKKIDSELVEKYNLQNETIINLIVNLLDN